MKKSIVMVMLTIFFVLLVLPITTAELQPLTEQQIVDLGPGKTGMLAGGISVISVSLSDEEFTTVELKVIYFNTNAEPITYKPYPMAFWEEREHTVKENYTYYLLPDLGWVSIEDEEISIPENHKYYVNVTITIPNEEAQEKSKDGGFIFLIASQGSGAQISAIPARKIFLTINHTPAIFSFILLILMLSVIIVVAIVMYYLSRKIKIKAEVEEDHV